MMKWPVNATSQSTDTTRYHGPSASRPLFTRVGTSITQLSLTGLGLVRLSNVRTGYDCCTGLIHSRGAYQALDAYVSPNPSQPNPPSSPRMIIWRQPLATICMQHPVNWPALK
jgi:hypothetical protein